MINFVYGRSAQAKSRHLMDMIAEDAASGIRSYLIVPEQFAVQSERLALRALQPSAQLTLEVLNFSRLYNRVCREYGGIEYNYITKPLRYTMMWENLRQLSPMLETYGQTVENDPSICDMMLAAVGEFKGCAISPSQLERAAGKLEHDHPLSKKLRDLALIYASFDNLVGHTFSDSADDISKLCDTLKEHDFFSEANVYIDAFSSFTAVEHEVIKEIFKQAKNVTVTVPLEFPREDTVFTGSILHSEAKLIKDAEAAGGHSDILIFDDTCQDPAISFLADNLWSSSQKTEPPAKHDSIHLYKCSSPYTEAEAAAACTLSLMREGYRCRDIVVLMRDAEAYRGIIEPAFERCGIPFYFSEKTPLSTTPIVKLLLSAIRIKLYNWRTTDVISHLKTGLYSFDARDIDLFEQYITTWQVKGSRFTERDFTMNPDGYTDELSERGKRILSAANDIRKKLCDILLPLFDELDNEETILEKCRSLYNFLSKSGAEGKLYALSQKEKERGNIRLSEEYSKMFGLCCDGLASLAETMSEDDICLCLDTEELYELLSLYFSQNDMGTIPTSADQVIIGSASTMRADAPKCVLILGLCEGVFPAAVSEGGLFTYNEKNLLGEMNIKLSPKNEFGASDELMYLQRSVSMPTEHLFMFSYTASADGRKASPSLPFMRAEKFYKDRLSNYDPHDILTLTPSAKAALSYLSDIEETPSGKVLREYAKNDGVLSSLITDTPIPVSDTECSVSSETADKVFGDKIYLSQSRIDKFVNCKFNYYCTYVLKLREEQISRFKANDIGTFIHYILEKLLCKIVKADGINLDIGIGDIEKMTREVVDEYIDRINPPGMPITARLSHLYKRLYKLSLLLISNIIDEFRHSDFRPEFFELNINGKNENPTAREFELRDGSKAVFSGIIDRVDILRLDDGKVYIRVVDYKTGTKQFSLDDIKHGLNIQMLLYLFTLMHNKNDSFNKKIGSDEPLAAGVVYLSSNIPMLEFETEENEESVFSAAQKQLKRSGLLLDDEKILRAMNDTLSSDFLGGIRKKADGTLSGKALATAELFRKLESDIEKTICDICEEMRSGAADASPLDYNKNDPCEYCAMKPICRIKRD